MVSPASSCLGHTFISGLARALAHTLAEQLLIYLFISGLRTSPRPNSYFPTVCFVSAQPSRLVFFDGVRRLPRGGGCGIAQQRRIGGARCVVRFEIGARAHRGRKHFGFKLFDTLPRRGGWMDDGALRLQRGGPARVASARSGRAGF